MNIKHHKLFPTLILDYDFSNHPENQKIIHKITTLPAKEHPLVKKGISNYTNNTSNLNFLKSSPSLLLDFQKCVDHYCKITGIRSGKISQSWFNIMKKGGKTYPHNHRGCILIGIYYPLLENNSCNLVLTNPLNYNKQCELPTNYNEYNSEYIPIKIQQNHLYICPGWIEHQTEVNKSQKRIVISFNVYPNYQYE